MALKLKPGHAQGLKLIKIAPGTLHSSFWVLVNSSEHPSNEADNFYVCLLGQPGLGMDAQRNLNSATSVTLSRLEPGIEFLKLFFCFFSSLSSFFSLLPIPPLTSVSLGSFSLVTDKRVVATQTPSTSSRYRQLLLTTL